MLMHHAIVRRRMASHLDLCVPISGGCADALLRTDLGILLDGDVLVGLES